MATISEELAAAKQHHQAGRLQAAEEIYRRILEVDQQQPEALHLLGLIAHQVGRHAIAIELIRGAIRLQPDIADFHSNLGEAYRTVRKLPEAVTCFERALRLEPNSASLHANIGLALKQSGRLVEAAASYRRALELRPDFAEAHHNLGNALEGQGQLAEAIACYRQALDLRPDYLGAYFSLGNAFKCQRRLPEAITVYQRALRIQPDNAEIYNNLGITLHDVGRLPEAVACYKQALQLQPNFAEAHNNLGNTLGFMGRLAEAASCFQQALQINPDFAEAHNNLGNTLNDQGRLAESIACYQRTLELRPDTVGTWLNLGNTYKDQGQLADALACYRRALELKPDYTKAHSNLVYALHFSPDHDARAIYEEHRHWNKLHAEPLAKLIRPHENERSPDRRLRIGYVSPDFVMHPVGRFLLPLLEAHDRQCVEVYCYSSVRSPDQVTEQCRAHADVWRPVLGHSDEQLAQTIRQDQIDILVDLTMHMAGNRLLVFARKPAPVQVTYLAYCGTTGLDAIDYRLTDPYLDPRPIGLMGPMGLTDAHYSEESVWLPDTYWCYRPPSGTPDVTPLPALKAKHITFGCLNNFCKVTDPTLETWSRLLEAVPDARLLLRAKAGTPRDHVLDFFTKKGIAAERLLFVDKVSLTEYFRYYERVDIALDPFPYGGGTTTCDALWMGVPVVTFAGRTAVGRGGFSILSNAGLPGLIAHEPAEYVRLAANLAGDLPRLQNMRVGMRDSMRASPLLDVRRFARAMEASYRAMWRRWCSQK